MKTILEYLQKGHIGKNKPCINLFDKLTQEEIEAIDTIADDFLDYYEDWYAEVNGTDISIKEFFNEYVGEDTTNLFLLLAYMLAADGVFDDWDIIGLTKYKGQHNPYDFGCFEEETDDGETVLDYIQDWLKNNKDNEYKFSFVFAAVRKNLNKFEDVTEFSDTIIDALR